MPGITLPRNVIYYSSNANPIPLAGIASLPYTDVIVAFLVPDGNLNLVGAGGAFDANLKKQDPDAATGRKECSDLIWGSDIRILCLPKLHPQCEWVGEADSQLCDQQWL